MKFSSVAVAASMALTASAQPTAPETFGLIAIHSGSGVQNSGFNAALGSVFAGLSGQNATCEGSDDGFATFYIKDEALFLYGPSGSTQQVYVDRSGMGRVPIPFRLISNANRMQARANSDTPLATSLVPATVSAPAGPLTTATTCSSTAAASSPAPTALAAPTASGSQLEWPTLVETRTALASLLVSRRPRSPSPALTLK